MDGKPLYEYARENKPLPRPIPVRECEVSIDLIDFKPAEVVPGDGGHTYTWPKERMSAEEKEVFSKLNKIVHDAGGEGATAEPEVDLSAPDMPEVSAKTGLRPATFTVRMTVSSGTYVRSIVHDIGLALGCGAHVVKLTRTRQGEFVLHGDEEELSKLDREAAQRALDASKMDDEEAAINAEVSEPAGPSGPSTGCIPWAVWERAIAERNQTLEQEAAEKEEMIASGASPEEIDARFSRSAIAQRRRTGELKEWEVEVLRRFVPVPLPVIRDSKWRASHT